MTAEFTSRIMAQGRALARAIEALGTIQPAGSFERALTRLLMASLSISNLKYCFAHCIDYLFSLLLETLLIITIHDPGSV